MSAPARAAGAPATPHAAVDTEVFRRRATRRVVLFVVLAVLLVGTCLASILLGQYQLPARELLHLVTIGPDAQLPAGAAKIAHSVVWNIRLPRLLLGLVVGAALGVAGALMQAVFANPLAEPSVIGVTSGAGVGAALAIVFGWSVLGASTVPAVAFVSAVVVTAAVYRMARFGGRVQVVNLILTGIAINAVCAALISFLVYLAPTTSREQIIFWQMGSLNGTQWKHVAVVVPIVVVGCAVSFTLGGRLDVLALGERAAGHIGIHVPRLRILAIGAATLLTAGAVAYAGLIGFVGLIVPHLLRGITGPSNTVLLPASALSGAVLIGLADIAARTVIPYADLPIGIFTALVGGPTFFVLLRRMMRKGTHA
ncbi:ABC transporter permease [Corynebacterium sp. 13CS0277]|uniref:FecCD family ABC transporter permease n=1 Tax=Corynebacterium sp. 13CS0277 TaxID=2071994 RepID=UPI000D032A5E|nr:iron ABC transporter permease [Corynebacterium sp. 13CS0277]PRQ11367.1 ABC transporter permease [Corynebacterium sp. 13CS0277]